MTVSILLSLGLFLVGMLLLALEAFVIPGFGVLGLAGAGVVGAAAYITWTSISPVWGIVLTAVALLSAMIFVVWIPRSRMGQRLTLKTRLDRGKGGYDAEAKRAGVIVGERGVTSTPLRPSGFAMFGDSRVEVRSEGEYLAPGTPVLVLEIKDAKVFVEADVSAKPDVEPDALGAEPDESQSEPTATG